MKMNKLKVIGMTAALSLALTACGGDGKSDKEDNKDTSSEEVTIEVNADVTTEADITVDETEAATQGDTLNMYWLNNHIAAAGTTVNESNTLPFYEGLAIDEVYDHFKDWYCIDQADSNPETKYKTMEQMYDKTLRSHSFLSFTMKETQELAASFDDGPLGIFTIVVVNPSDDEVTVGEAVSNEWYVYSMNNGINVYDRQESPLYISLGYESQRGHVSRDDNFIVMEDYLIPALGEINYISVDTLTSSFETIDDILNAEFGTYNIGWVGTEYSVFTSVTKDYCIPGNGPQLEYNSLLIVPANMYEYSEYYFNSFISAGFHATINDSNMLDR